MSKNFRKKIFKRDEYKCQYCGWWGKTIDHVIPVSAGGKTTEDNCVCACKKCNQEKKNLNLEDFLKKSPIIRGKVRSIPQILLI